MIVPTSVSAGDDEDEAVAAEGAVVGDAIREAVVAAGGGGGLANGVSLTAKDALKSIFLLLLRGGR